MAASAFWILLIISPSALGYFNEINTCDNEMFENDFSAYMACATQFALQSNWFPSPIAGLSSYLSWNGLSAFWQNGAVLETFVNFMKYGNNTRYLSVVRNSYRPLSELLRAYGPYPSFDDILWYGISYIRIYEILGKKEFLSSSVDIFRWCWDHGWDQSMMCGGGMWFDNMFFSKQAITNVQMIQLGTKVFLYTKGVDTLQKIRKVLDFIFKNHFIDRKSFIIKDSIDPITCQVNNISGTYTNGVFIGGLVAMYKITNNNTYLSIAEKVARATISANSDSDGVFTETTCEPHCNDDEKMFKGIFVRYLRYLIDGFDDRAKRSEYQRWMEFNIKANIKHNSCDRQPITKCNIKFKNGPPFYIPAGPVFSPTWSGPFTVSEPMQQISVLDLFVSSISPNTKCIGKLCSYDPFYPQPKKLNCDSNPCPRNQACCEFVPSASYGCCAEGQICNNLGICV